MLIVMMDMDIKRYIHMCRLLLFSICIRELIQIVLIRFCWWLRPSLLCRTVSIDNIPVHSHYVSFVFAVCVWCECAIELNWKLKSTKCMTDLKLEWHNKSHICDLLWFDTPEGIRWHSINCGFAPLNWKWSHCNFRWLHDNNDDTYSMMFNIESTARTNTQ